VKRKKGDLFFTLFVPVLVLACYFARGLDGMASLSLAFFLPLYLIRLVVWSSWSRLSSFLAAKLNPRAWTLLVFCIWGGQGILIWLVAPSTLPTWSRIAGLVIAAGGTLMAYWAQWLLGLNTAILTARIFDQEKNDTQKVISTGPFALVPHPIFVGEWLVALGCFLLTEQIALLAMLPVAILTDTFAARGEEKDLCARFGDQYKRYRSKFSLFLRRKRD
jgi:protein-S-isoprenylcysteine O-methyltransferase Ste14